MKWKAIPRSIAAAATLTIALAIVALWLFSRPEPYHVLKQQHIDAIKEYDLQDYPGCSPLEFGQLASADERQVRANDCAHIAESHRKNVNELAQEARGLEAAEKGSWAAVNALHLSRLQLLLTGLGLVVSGIAAFGVLYALQLNRKATDAAVRAVTITEEANRIARESATSTLREMKVSNEAAVAAIETARGANAIAERNGLLANRPWLVLELNNIALRRETGGLRVEFSYSFRNFGSSPALVLKPDIIASFDFIRPEHINSPHLDIVISLIPQGGAANWEGSWGVMGGIRSSYFDIMIQARYRMHQLEDVFETKSFFRVDLLDQQFASLPVGPVKEDFRVIKNDSLGSSMT